MLECDYYLDYDEPERLRRVSDLGLQPRSPILFDEDDYDDDEEYIELPDGHRAKRNLLAEFERVEREAARKWALLLKSGAAAKQGTVGTSEGLK